MIGRRVAVEPHLYEPGDYGLWEGLWYCLPRVGFLGCLGNGVQHHKVTEHEDGTITAFPSILVSDGMNADAQSWHGHLERGVWREC